MKTNELKVGDRVKYDFGENTILDICSQGNGIIQKFVAADRVKISGVPFDFNLKWITSKLETVYQTYKEIPIEKEPISCKVCRNYTNSDTKVTDYICPICQFGIDMALKQEKAAWKVILEALRKEIVSNKEIQDGIERVKKAAKEASISIGDLTTIIKSNNKSEPKSFKFDISFVNRVEFNQSPYRPSEFPECFFKIEGHKITYHPDNPKNFPEAFGGKEYTIEIREKDETKTL
jgi:hypothetical protein